MHHPNPFDFVLFDEKPYVRQKATFDQMGDMLSGYLDVRLKALTPIHIVGHQRPGNGHGESFMNRQGGRACIPASSIRGCLRAFIEALTSGWVSQATPAYPKKFKDRHIGFQAFEAYQNKGRSNRRESPPAIEPDFKPVWREEQILDVASYLFGVVFETDNQEKKDLARKSKVWIEDAYIPDAALDDGTYVLPDIKDAGGRNSFMGGAKPSASNWWYFQPAEIWRRNIRGRQIAEFVGGQFWGRKFYFHQDPEKCVAHYQTKWRFSGKRPYYPIHLECLVGETETFRIYLDDVPEQLAALLVLAFSPGQTIRHKLGYGKAYGYGSAQFTIEGAMLRKKARIPAPLTDHLEQVRDWEKLAWDQEQLQAMDLNELIHWEALVQLAGVLGWHPDEELLFVYPPFDKKYFMQPVAFNDVTGRLPEGVSPGDRIEVDLETGDQIADAIFELKKPVHFQYYQETAEGWDKVVERMP